MTNTEIIQAIKAEAERLNGENHNHADRWDMGYDAACEKILDFLDSLESEKPMNQDGLEKEYEDYVVKDPCFSKLVNRNAGLVVARHFFDLGCRRTAEKYDEIEYNRQRAEEHLATSGKTISVKPGDEVAINGHKIVYYKDKGYVTIVKSEESVPNDLEEMADKYEQEFFTDATLGEAFIAGAEWDREQMMKEAVEYEVWDFSSSLEDCPHVNIPLDNKQYRSGDKIRVIIVKEDEK